jgi:hypothetical protein
VLGGLRVAAREEDHVMVRAVHLRVLPETRGECRGDMRPCPFVSCRHHLLLHVTSRGRLYAQGREYAQEMSESDVTGLLEALDAMPETCALDVADKGEHTFEQVAAVMGIDVKEAFRHYEIAAGRVEVLVADEHPDDPYFRLMAERSPKEHGEG